jgi:hypothetical protein
MQAPAAPPAAQAPASAVIADVVVGKTIENRAISDSGSTFPASVGMLVAMSSVSGASGSKIMHVWSHGPHADTISLSVGGSPWRTYSRKTIPADWTGEWKVTVLDATGAVIATKTFTIGG